jgi:ubiquinone/menaquinone biosynthesis C-methylase UbiE
MEHQRTGDPTYVLGRSTVETRRLEQQGDFFRPLTRHLFEQAGITPGMKVLDLGSGPGDVALLAAEMVGPTGHVVGVDSNPALVATARERAYAAGMSQVSFFASDIRDLALEPEFDAVVGRFILMYPADPVAALRAALRALRDDGLAVFCEGNMLAGGVASYPPSPLHQLVGRCVSETFARGGVELEMGWKLYQVFLDAGLPGPQLRTDTLIGGGQEWLERFAPYVANILRSMMPLILEYGIASEEEIGIESFEERYRDEILSQRGVVQWWTVVGAWARKRAAEEAAAQGTERWSD